MMERYAAGQPLRRVEDVRFLKGAGRYLDDVHMDGLAHACIVRSLHAHARVLAVDTRAASALKGTLCVLTGNNWVADGLGAIPTRTAAKNSDGTPVPTPERPALVVDRVRFVGDAVVLVVAETPAVARAAAELVSVSYAPLAAVTSARAALAPGAPEIWEHIPGNLCVEFGTGDARATEAALARAAHVVSVEVDNQRVTGAPIEPRGAIGCFDSQTEHFTLICATQNVHANRNQLAKDVFHVAAEQIRQVAYDVGGGFGVKNALYPEHALVLWAARRLRRPVKWVADRGESFLSDSHGRDQQGRVTLGLDEDGRFLALKVDCVASIGPYLLSTGPFTCTGGTARTQGGPYRIPALYFHARAAFTNTAPTDPYRGAGRPEATFQIERVIDVAAATLGFDRAALRRMNLLRRDELPHTTGAGIEIECGDFPKVFDAALASADWEGFPHRAAQARARGKLRGIGVCAYLECTGGGPREYARISLAESGRVTLAVGSQSTGTGHETVLAQLVAARLGVPMARIDYVQGDTDATPLGGGHGGSRSLETGGAATVMAVERVVERGRERAGVLLEAAVEDVEFGRGTFRVVGTDRTVSLEEVVRQAELVVAEEYERPGITFPNGCHVAEVELDPESGEIALVGYTVCDDFGTIINPLTAAGQVMGGVAQGVGQALFEHVVYAADSGQLLSGSFLDYAVPRARDLPDVRVAFFEDAPSARNPLGVKGSGEAGCCGALAAVVGAVTHALADLGVHHVDMPLTPERIWRAINGKGCRS